MALVIYDLGEEADWKEVARGPCEWVRQRRALEGPVDKNQAPREAQSLNPDPRILLPGFCG